MKQSLINPLINDNSNPSSLHQFDGTDAKQPTQHQAFNSISPISAIKEIIKSAIPMGLSYTFSFSIVALVILMGHLGNDEQERQNYLDASPLLATLLNTVDSIAIASLFSIGILTSNKRAQLFQQERDLTEATELTIKRRQEISNILKNGMLLSVISIPLPVTIMCVSEAILVKFGQDTTISNLVQNYSRRYAIAFPALLFRMTFEQIMFGFEKQVPAMLIGLGNFALGALLAGLLGLKKYGLAGIAGGFITEAYLTGISYGLYLGCHKEFKIFNFFKNFKFNKQDWQQIKSLLRIGVPMAVTIVNEVVASFIISLFIGWLGPSALTAWDFFTWVSFFTIIMSASTAQVTSQKVSGALGEKNYLNARRYALCGLPASMMLTMPVCITLAAAPKILTNLIANNHIDSQETSIIRPVLAMAIPIVAADSIRYNMVQTSRAVNDNIIPSVVSTISIWFGVLIAYLLGFKSNLGIYGVEAGFGIGMLVSVVLLFFRWRNNIKPETLATYSEITNDTTIFLKEPLKIPSESERRPLLESDKELQQYTI